MYPLFVPSDGPVCTQPRQVVTAIEGETVELPCNIDANPGNVSFYWTFNNTVDSTTFRDDEVIFAFILLFKLMRLISPI